MTTTRDTSSEVNAAQQFPAPPARISSIAIPLIYAGMGVALGTTAGLALAIFGAPTSVSAALNDSTPTVSTTSAPATSPGAQSGTSEYSPPALVVQVADHGDSADHRTGTNTMRANPAPRLVRSDITGHGGSAAHQPGRDTMQAHRSPGVERPNAVSAALAGRASAGSKNLLLRPVRMHRHRKRHITDSAQNTLASVPEIVPGQMDSGQQSFNQATEPQGFYTEGDFTVADYDANGGTIESSDGRTFVVGVTIAARDASSWSDYRPVVHYRCSQTGSCTLSGPGVVAPNARLI